MNVYEISFIIVILISILLCITGKIDDPRTINIQTQEFCIKHYSGMEFEKVPNICLKYL